MQKKCVYCGEIIEIDVDNIQGVAKLTASSYYHTKCLLKLSLEKRTKKRHAVYWDTMENDIYKYENAAKDTIMNVVGKDRLTEHILMYYDVVTVPQRLWDVIGGLNSGKYKSRKCKPVNSWYIYETWKWGQHKLDETARYNKVNNKGPTNDSDRVLYDLAIVIGKIPVYLKHKEKQKVEEAERMAAEKEKIRIDYSKIATNTSKNTDGLDDISELLDDMF